MKVKITKLKELEDAEYPNNIPEGFERIDYFWPGQGEPVIGERFWVGRFNTSLVQEIIDAETFRTLNSVYKWEIIPE